MHAFQAGKEADRAAVDTKLDALRRELQEQMLSVTRSSRSASGSTQGRIRGSRMNRLGSGRAMKRIAVVFR
jgi:hypothetical protein